MGHRKMSAYGEREHNGRYVLDDYEFSRNHTKMEMAGATEIICRTR